MPSFSISSSASLSSYSRGIPKQVGVNRCSLALPQLLVSIAHTTDSKLPGLRSVGSALIPAPAVQHRVDRQ
ncbi:hypothetical protein BDW72DRAFT_164427 [Aspergillus terricola var. indicus]